MFDRLLKVENFLTNEECNLILEKYLPTLDFTSSTLLNGKLSNKRKSSTVYVDNIIEIEEKVNKVLNENLNIKGHKISELGPYEFARYKSGEFYDWHKDFDENHNDSVYSIMIQLNDDYEEGYLQLKNEEDRIIQLDKNLGTLYIYFSSLSNRIIPVKSGIKYCLINQITLKKDENYIKTLI